MDIVILNAIKLAAIIGTIKILQFLFFLIKTILYYSFRTKMNLYSRYGTGRPSTK
jgi:hypothetical protein